jgi:hypothetical protein
MFATDRPTFASLRHALSTYRNNHVFPDIYRPHRTFESSDDVQRRREASQIKLPDILPNRHG